MPKIMLNGIEYASGIDHQKLLKIGDAPLDTTADNLSDAVNELKQSLSNIGFDYSDFRCFVKRPINMDRFMAVIPCTTPLPTSVTVNSFQYMGNGWTSLTLDVASIIGSSIVLQFNLPSGVTISNGLDYWAKGNITLNYT